MPHAAKRTVEYGWSPKLPGDRDFVQSSVNGGAATGLANNTTQLKVFQEMTDKTQGGNSKHIITMKFGLTFKDSVTSAA